MFAALFLVQAALFLWVGVVRRQLSFAVRGTVWTSIGCVLVAYALAYPAINAVQHGSDVARLTWVQGVLKRGRLSRGFSGNVGQPWGI